MLLGFDLWRDIFGIKIGENRARELEKEWSYQLETVSHGQADGFKNAFLSFWYESGTTALKEPRSPLLFINTTQVQKGSHAILSPVVLNSSIYLGMDLLDTLYKVEPNLTIPINTATLLNASFPYINPAGNVSKIGSFVDAGYYDNYGARTAKALIEQLKKMRDDPTSTDSLQYLYKQIQFISILIRNGTVSPGSPASTTTSQLAAPPSTIGNIRSAVNAHNRRELQETADKNYEINLTRVNIMPADFGEPIKPIIPLARFLSPMALEAMDASQDSIRANLDRIAAEMKVVD
jgi:hypothetical protein